MSDWDNGFRKQWESQTVWFNPFAYACREYERLHEGGFHGFGEMLRMGAEPTQLDEIVKGGAVPTTLPNTPRLAELLQSGLHVSMGSVWIRPGDGKLIQMEPYFGPDFSVDNNCWVTREEGDKGYMEFAMPSDEEVVFWTGACYRKEVSPDDFLGSYKSIGFTLDDGVITEFYANGYTDISDLDLGAKLANGDDLKEVYANPEDAAKALKEHETGLMY